MTFDQLFSSLYRRASRQLEEPKRVVDVMSIESALLGRQMERDSLRGAMVAAGAKFDDATATWVIADEEDVL